jgi:hypothetical protein
MSIIDPNLWPYSYVFTKPTKRSGSMLYEDIIVWLIDNLGAIDIRWTWRIRLLDNNDLVFYFRSQQDLTLFVLSCT